MFSLRKFKIHLTIFDRYVITGLILVVSIASYYIFAVVGAVLLVVVAIFLLLLLIIMLYEHYRRMQKKFDDQWAHYYQIEALQSLHSLIDIRSPLPQSRGWAASPDFLLVLVQEVLRYKPQLIVDLGSGVSTIVAGYLVEKNGGKVLSVDHDVVYAKKTEALIADHGLAGIATVVVAPLRTQKVNEKMCVWYDLTDVKIDKKIDLLIVDGPPESTQSLARYPAVPKLYAKLAKKGVIIIDDSRGSDLQHAISKWQEQFPDLICENFDTEKGTAVLRRQPM